MKRGKIRNFIYSFLEFVYLPIISGRLKGKLWIMGCSGKIFRFITTTYELPQTKLFEKYVKKDGVVYDIGAHVGYFTLLSSLLVGDIGKVYAFEPNKKILKLLHKHIEINKCTNVVIIEKAVSNTNCLASFSIGDGSWDGKLSKTGEYKVETVKLDDFVTTNNILPPDLIKIDVEGEELNVLMGTKNLLIKFYPVIFLSAHSQELYKNCSNFLISLGYEISGVNKMKDLIVGYKKIDRNL